MRIAILCPGHSYGDERVVCRQALTLAQAGHMVDVWGREDPDKRPPQHSRLRLHSAAPMTRGASLQARLYRLRALWTGWQGIRRSSPDLIAAHEPESALVALWAGRRKKIPVHFDVHECFEELLAARAPRRLAGLVRRLAWAWLAWLARHCDYVTVVSPVTLRRYQAVRPGRRTDLIHNSPPVELFPLCNHEQDYPLTICHEGWLDRSRGLEPLLRAIALAAAQRPVRLLIVGQIGAGSRADFQRLVGELGLGDKVEVTGWRPYEEVGRLDAAAQVGVVALQPSGNNYGSLSNKVYSYMACGQAVIVPHGSATAELVEQYRCGVAVDVTRPDELARAILEFQSDRERRRALGLNGRRAIEQELGWQIMSERLLSAYGALMARLTPEGGTEGS